MKLPKHKFEIGDILCAKDIEVINNYHFEVLDIVFKPSEKTPTAEPGWKYHMQTYKKGAINAKFLINVILVDRDFSILLSSLLNKL